MEGPFHAYRGAEPYVFVCYAHADDALVFADMENLKNLGFNVWYDEGIQGGTIWRQEVADAILGCRQIVFFVTPRSVASTHCAKEVSFGLESGKPLVVVYLEETKLPPAMQLTIGDLQAIKKFETSAERYQRQLRIALGNEQAERGYKPYKSSSGFTDATLSVAVLPFANMSGDPSQESLCDGMAEEITSGLTRFSTIKVIARTSSFRFKGTNTDVRVIGEELNVNHILEGSVRRSANRVRISAQLINVSDGTRIWSERYDRQMQDVFDLQDEITAEILTALDVHLGSSKKSVRERTVKLDAYNAVLFGRYHAYRMEYELAIKAFEEALAIEPEYADAHAQLAKVADVQANVTMDPAKRRLCSVHTSQALSINRNQPLARSIQLQQLYLGGEFQRALDSFGDLVRKFPNELDVILFYADTLKCLNFDEASLRLHDRAVDLDPLNALSHFQMGIVLRRFGHYEEAGAAYKRAEQLGMAVAGELASMAMDRMDSAMLWEQVNRPPEEWGLGYYYHPAFKLLALMYDGRDDEAQATLPVLEARVAKGSHFDRWIVTLLKGEWEAASVWLKRGIEARDYMMFEHALGTVGYRANFPDAFEHPTYLTVRKELGIDEASLRELTIQRLPF